MTSKIARKPVVKRASTKAPALPGKSSSVSSKIPTFPIEAAATKAIQVQPKLQKKEAKASTTAKPKLAAKAADSKIKKTKLVRDSFTIPKDEYAGLQKLKERAIGLAKSTKKGELLRAGLLALATMSDTAFLATLAGIPALKTGRPKGAKTSKK